LKGERALVTREKGGGRKRETNLKIEGEEKATKKWEGMTKKIHSRNKKGKRAYK